MTYAFGPKSKNKLTGVSPTLKNVLQKALDWGVMDFSILEGVRTLERQKQLVATGMSQTLDSKHLMQADGYSHAVDFAPFPLNWRDVGSFYILAGVIKAAAAELGVKVRFGCDWDGDGQTLDQTFHDLGHVELID